MKTWTRTLWAPLLAAVIALAPGCAAVPHGERGGEYYALDDFAAVEKIDAHVHVHGRADALVAQAARDNFRLLTINVDYPDFPPIADQQQAAISLRQRYPERVAFAATFSVDAFQSQTWSREAVREVDAAIEQGAVGVKIWKNVGMALRDADGGYVMPDDARFEPLFAHLENRHIVLLGHQAEPLNCWLPLDEMTVRSDREYFQEHPQYYMYRHPEMPSHEAILAARDRMLRAHPGMRFDAVHLASLEWDVDRIAEFLERFPQASVDVAARMVHLEYQAARDPAKVRAFLIRYQDRILYGSDDSYGPDENAEIVAQVHAGWLEDWRFLVTDDELHTDEFTQPFRGLHLPRIVVDKLYRLNAQAMFVGAWNNDGR